MSGIDPRPTGNSRPGIFFLVFVSSKVATAPIRMRIEVSIAPKSPIKCRAEDAKMAYARKSPSPTTYFSSGSVATDTTLSYPVFPIALGIAFDSTTMTSRAVRMKRNVIENVVGTEVPIRAPRRVAEPAIKAVALFGDNSPKYPLTDQFRPIYPKGRASRKIPGETPEAWRETFKSISPDMVPAIVTPETMRRADISGRLFIPTRRRASKRIETRSVVTTSMLSDAGPAGNPALRAYNATEPAATAPRTGMTRYRISLAELESSLVPVCVSVP